MKLHEAIESYIVLKRSLGAVFSSDGPCSRLPYVLSVISTFRSFGTCGSRSSGLSLRPRSPVNKSRRLRPDPIEPIIINRMFVCDSI